MVNVKEYIYPKMDILFLGINVPKKSNENKKLFSGTKSFWNKLFDSGLITERIEKAVEGEEKVFASQKINYQNWFYGFTDLNRDIVQTNSSKVSTTLIQVKRILDILHNNHVKKLCIMHSRVARKFDKAGLISRFSGVELYGYGQVGQYNRIKIYEIPFHNASKNGIAEIYKCLKKQ